MEDQDSFECMECFKRVATLIAVHQGKGLGEGLGYSRGLKSNLYRVEAVPGARRRQWIFFMSLSEATTATVLVGLQVRGRKH